MLWLANATHTAARQLSQSHLQRWLVGVRRFTSKRASRLGHAAAVILVVSFASIMFFGRLGERALWSSHEGRAAQHARLMIDTGQWGMPTLYMGAPDYQKPPLFYWMVAWVASVRGGQVDEWSVRLPAATAALAGMILTYAAGRSLWQPVTGCLAAFLVVSNLRYSWLARVGRIDMPLMLAISSALVCFLFAYRRLSNSKVETGQPSAGDAEICGRTGTRRTRGVWCWLVGTYLATAIAVLLKGPIGVVLPAVVILFFLAIERQPVWPWNRGFAALMHHLGIWWGIPMVLALASPWFIWATAVTQGDFFKAFFVHHHLDRTLGLEGLKPEPVWYYVPRLLVDMFPWSILLPVALFMEWRRPTESKDCASRFALCWVTGMFLVLSLVRFKRHDYLLPLVPGAALFLARYWEQLFHTAPSGQWRWVRRFAIVILASVVGITSIFLAMIWAPQQALWDSEWAMRDWLQKTDAIIWTQIHAAIAQSPRIAVVIGVGSVIGGIACWWFVERRNALAAAGSAAALWFALFQSYVHFLLPLLEPLREQRTIAQAARQYGGGNESIYYYGREDQQLMFYLGSGARWLPNRTALRPVITKNEPVFVVMELERFKIRQADWPEVPMMPLAWNTDNPLRTHRSPAVLVTNPAGLELVQSLQLKSSGPGQEPLLGRTAHGTEPARM